MLSVIMPEVEYIQTWYSINIVFNFIHVEIDKTF